MDIAKWGDIWDIGGGKSDDEADHASATRQSIRIVFTITVIYVAHFTGHFDSLSKPDETLD